LPDLEDLGTGINKMIRYQFLVNIPMKRGKKSTYAKTSEKYPGIEWIPGYFSFVLFLASKAGLKRGRATNFYTQFLRCKQCNESFHS
jgi:hypothetical protein